MFTQDFILNGEGHGETASAVLGTNSAVGFNPGFMRPYIDRRGRPWVTVNVGRKFDAKAKRLVPVTRDFPADEARARGFEVPTTNATSLRKFEWVMLDDAVVKAARTRLFAWADLRRSSTVGGFDGMATMTYEYEAMTDPGEAVVDMDALADARNDSPLFKLRSVPLPITKSDFWFSRRRLAVSRNKGQPLNTTMAEAAGRRVAEKIEDTLIGTEVGVQYGTNSVLHDGVSKVYGYSNFPYRITKTDLTTPTGSNPEAVKQDFIKMRELLYAQGFYGPFMCYTTPAYDAFFDDDYFRTGGTSVNRTLRERIMEIGGIAGVRRLDRWNPTTPSTYQIVMVQMDPMVAQAIDGMGVTTVQWESQGGARLNFRVMAIQVPLLKSPYNGIAAMVHGTTA